MTSEQDIEEQKILLQKEYSPYLDSSVVLAIINDYDSLDNAREVLEQLKEVTAFDDPGPSGFGAGDNNSSSDWGNNYNNFDDETPETSVSVRSNDGDSPATGDSGREKGGAHAKMAQLASMFPKFSPFTLRHTLDKCQGDVDRAVDELLNRYFLDEEGEGGKGIDEFAEDLMLALPSPGGKRKGKGKNKRRNSSGLLSPMSPRSASASDWSDSGLGSGGWNSTKSKWTSVTEEVAYLSTMLNLPRPTVASAYHEHGSLSATVLPLVKAHGQCETMPEDTAHLENVHELAALVPKLPPELANGVLKLTKGNVHAAEELSRYILQSIRQQLLPPTPLSPLSSDDNGGGVSKQKQAWQTVSNRKDTYTAGQLSPTSPTGPRYARVAARDAAASEFAARNEAFDKAHAAYRRSKSDKLMGAAATYYADVGRSHDARAKTLGLEAAEALVDENVNTIPGESLDLHGVTVQQAVKITRERVTQWWVSAARQHGEDVIIKGIQGQGGVGIRPFRIITGKGTHSRNGETKLGPAVAKMLVKEMWKIEVRNGYITVHGVAKRK